jgi:hypothetical protein
VRAIIGAEEKFAVLKGIAKNSFGNMLCEVELCRRWERERTSKERVRDKGKE